MSVLGEHDGIKSSKVVTRSSMPNIQIRVLVAATGFCYRINLHPNELTVANIRRQLGGAVPIQDQILLLGPPYKVPKDSSLRSEEMLASFRLGDEEDNNAVQSPSGRRCSLGTPERSGARRLFLFSKEALSDTAPEPPPCALEPMVLKLPTEPDPSPLVFDHSASHISPLNQALEVYERRFMLNLCRGRALADGADLRITSCRTCISEQIIMARALRAAVSNLSDHRNSALRTRTEFTSDFQSKIATHALILDSFEKVLSDLAEVSLHPSLVSIARSSGRMMETLLDTVPVDKSKEWANQCRKSHERLHSLFVEVTSAFDQLGSSSSREEESRADYDAENEIQSLFTQVENNAIEIRNKQAKRLGVLIRDHGEVVRVIMGAISGPVDQSESAQAAFTILENMSKSSSDILPSMETDDAFLFDLMKRVASSKTKFMKLMRSRMRQISLAQSNIQRVLSSVSVLRDALAQQCENIVHLERVTELKASYSEFISEIRRRRAYGNAVTSISAAMMERLALMRSDEVKARERFLRKSGKHLMPPFFEIFAPTLAMPPPLFTPQLPAMVEMDTLPDVGSSDSQQFSAVTTSESGSSSIDIHQKSDLNTTRNISENGLTTAHQDSTDQQSLIISADEQSNEIMTTENENRIEEEAERKTLRYENAMLRQTLERMGHKPSKSYLKGLEGKKNTTHERKIIGESAINYDEINTMSSKITSLEKELLIAKEEAQSATSKLLQITDSLKNNDKISHSSFAVGDVGLFMPTGRSGRAERKYLAFHSNCPHRYLSPDCIEGSPDYILGRIVFQEEFTAGLLGTDLNPFGLHIGTTFWMLTVEVLKLP